MLLLPPELTGAIGTVIGVALRELAAAGLAALRARRMRPVQEIDDMADSARFQAIEESIARLTLAADKRALDDGRKIAALEQSLSEARQELADARGDLLRATRSATTLELAVRHLHAELQSLRAEVGLPPIPTVETYLQETPDHADPEPRASFHDRRSGSITGVYRPTRARGLPPPRLPPDR